MNSLRHIKIVLLFLPAFFYIVNVAAEPQSSAEKQQLVFLNWPDYIDPDLVEKFEQQHNAEIITVDYHSNETRDQLLLETEALGYDLIVMGDLKIKLYKERGWITALDKAQTSNLKHIDQHWIDIVPEAKGYAVPYFWGTVGIAYRKDLVKEPITKWQQLFKPAPYLRGRFSMNDDTRDIIGMALIYLGYSNSSIEPAQIDEAKRLLLEQKPHVKYYRVLEIHEDSELLSGDVIAGMAWSGDALQTAEHNPDIVYVVPEEGSSVWIDYLVVSAKSKVKDLAFAFINFLNEPANAAQLAEYLHYASPNIAAEKLLPPEFLADPAIYPGKKLIQNSPPYKILPPRIQNKYNTIGIQVMR
jgi:spermidine/putrescine transport system substrate-binding protein